MVQQRGNREGDDQQANNLFGRLPFLLREPVTWKEDRTRRWVRVLVFRQKSSWICAEGVAHSVSVLVGGDSR